VRVLLVCVLAALLTAAPAYGEPPTDRPLTGERITASLAAAADFWDVMPPCEIRVYQATNAELEAFTRVPSQAATYTGVQGPVCPIWLSETLAAPSVANRLRVGLDLTHEVGHRLGYGHDDVPWSIMNPTGAGMPWPVFRRFAPRGYIATWRAEHPDEPWATRPAA
jgi:hypothetical protein